MYQTCTHTDTLYIGLDPAEDKVWLPEDKVLLPEDEVWYQLRSLSAQPGRKRGRKSHRSRQRSPYTTGLADCASENTRKLSTLARRPRRAREMMTTPGRRWKLICRAWISTVRRTSDRSHQGDLIER